MTLAIWVSLVTPDVNFESVEEEIYMDDIEKGVNRLTQEQIDVLMNLLHGRREELTSLIANLNQQMTTRDDCSITDVADAASLQETRLRSAGLARQHGQMLEEIDHALGRLKYGSYGISESSGNAIPYERLLLVPWARSGAGE